jgi:hypothetical protein
MLQVRNKLHDDFIAVDGDGSNALDASELNVLFSKLGLAAPEKVRSFVFSLSFSTLKAMMLPAERIRPNVRSKLNRIYAEEVLRQEPAI